MAHPLAGKPLSEETKAKMAEARRKLWADPSSAYNQRVRGRKHTTETRAKMSAAHADRTYYRNGHAPPRPEGSIVRGYRILAGYKGHPLAHQSGSIYEHRLVLYQKIGPGPHDCHWGCGKVLEWKGLDSDHIDGDKLNNDPNNLVPSCPTCNKRRACAGNSADWRA